MRTLVNTVTTPPGGFRYVQAETKTVLEAQTWNDLVTAVKKHRALHKIPVGSQFEMELQDQLCRTLPPNWCEYQGYDKPLSNRFSDKLTLKQVLQGTATLLEHFVRGGKTVEINEATRRAAICAECPFNRPVSDCIACSQKDLREMVTRFVGGQATKWDSLINSCQICGCSLRAAVHIPIDIIHHYQTKEQNEALPEWCWKSQAP